MCGVWMQFRAKPALITHQRTCLGPPFPRFRAGSREVDGREGVQVGEPLRGLEGVPGLPGAPQDEAGLTRKFLCDPMNCSLPGSSVHGLFQAIVLEWIAISFSSGSSRSWDGTQVSSIVDITHSSILAWRIPWTEEPGRQDQT